MKKSSAISTRKSLIHPSVIITMLFVWVCLLISTLANSQTVNAADILAKINKAEPVILTGVTIVGDLDFTTLKKKYRGGSYGARNGVVKEFFTKLRAPLSLTDCTIEGEIITFSEDKKPGILKENFVAFDKIATFQKCRFKKEVRFERMTFYQGIKIIDCTFDESLRFERVHFSAKPIVKGGNAADKLQLKKTNWEEMTSVQPTLKKKDRSEDVTVIFHNDTFKNIKIRFDHTTWNLNAKGKSSLMTKVGTEVYLLNNGQKDRLLLTASKELDGQEFKLSKL